MQLEELQEKNNKIEEQLQQNSVLVNHEKEG